MVHVPYRLRKPFSKIHTKLVRELEKKFSGKVSCHDTNVVLCLILENENKLKLIFILLSGCGFHCHQKDC